MENQKIDWSKLPPDLKAKLQSIEDNKPERRSLVILEDVANMLQEVIGLMDDNQSIGKSNVKQFGAILVDMRESLKALVTKEDPEIPDYAKPVVEAITKMEKSFGEAVKQIDVKPDVKIDPQITVQPTEVTIDMTELNKAVKGIPKAFQDAVKLIPQPVIPQTDFSQLIEMWSGISEQLESIDTATRLKPQPGKMNVTNPDGSTVSDVNLKQSNIIKFATVSINGAGDNQIVAAVALKKLKLLSACLIASGTTSMKWRSNTTDLSGAMPLVVNSGFVLPASAPGMGHYLESATGEALNINLSAGVTVTGHITYYEEA